MCRYEKAKGGRGESSMRSLVEGELEKQMGFESDEPTGGEKI